MIENVCQFLFVFCVAFGGAITGKIENIIYIYINLLGWTKRRESIRSTRWAPTSYKWAYNPYKRPYTWVTGVTTLLGVISSPFITGFLGPPCTPNDLMSEWWTWTALKADDGLDVYGKWLGSVASLGFSSTPIWNGCNLAFSMGNLTNWTLENG